MKPLSSWNCYHLIHRVDPKCVCSHLGKGLNSAEVSQALLDEVLSRAAGDVGMTVEQLRSLPPGRHRRIRHDDISVAVLVLS